MTELVNIRGRCDGGVGMAGKSVVAFGLRSAAKHAKIAS